jgi:Zn-dependent protease
MFSMRFRLFRLAGIPINLDASWLIILALLTATLAGYFREVLPGLAPGTDWALGLGTALLFFVCIVLHELGHALTARRLGIPLRGITLFLFGGVAELEGEPASAGHEFLMAIAGPVVSAVLAAVFWILALLGDHAGWAPALIVMFAHLAWINAAVLVFNMVPAFPLDGGRVFRSILWGLLGNLRRATYWAAILGRGFAVLLIVLGVINFFGRQPIQGLWLGLIGLFLHQAATGSYQQVLIRQALRGEPVRRFMNPTPIVVPPDLDLGHWVEDYVFRYHHKAYPVSANGHLEGVVTTSALAKFPREEWGVHTIAEIMRRDLRDISLPPDADALQALERMQRTGSSRLLVTDGDRLVGLISMKDLLRFLQLKLDLDEQSGTEAPAAWSVTDGREVPVRR